MNQLSWTLFVEPLKLRRVLRRLKTPLYDPSGRLLVFFRTDPYEECSGPAQIFRKVTGGVKPESFEKVDHPGFKGMIDWCTQRAKSDRPTMKQLMNHEFFEDFGFTLQLVNRKSLVKMRESIANFRLKFIDKRTSKVSGPSDQPTIELSFDLESDDIKDINGRMLKLEKLENEEDRRNVALKMENQLQAVLKERKNNDKHTDLESSELHYPPNYAKTSPIVNKPVAILCSKITNLRSQINFFRFRGQYTVYGL